MHFGSLVTAVASYVEARVRAGQWLLRIEDIDPPREQPGADTEILRALERHGFEWDGVVSYQSASRDAHEVAIQALAEAGMAYPCGCSRSDLADAAHGPLGAIYPGTCRAGCSAPETALRVRTESAPVAFCDRLQGTQSQSLESESGDFVILRRDGLIAYQLAVVVDDHLQGITDVVRGVDLMASTPRQIWLQSLLGYAVPGYCHVPVVVDRSGQKLSKSQGAAGLAADRCSANLVTALTMLGQRPPRQLVAANVDEIWQWAFETWDITVMYGVTEIPAPPDALGSHGK